MSDFQNRRAVAIELLTNHHERLTRKAGQFLGQVAVEQLPLTPAQVEWFNGLADRAGLTVEA